MRHQQHSLLSQHPSQAKRKQILPHVRIDGTEGVIQEINVGIAVAGSSQGDAGSLSSRNIHSPLPDLGVESIHQLLEVWFELAHSHHFREALLVQREPKEDIVSH